jgi:hypothetical protein
VVVRILLGRTKIKEEEDKNKIKEEEGGFKKEKGRVKRKEKKRGGRLIQARNNDCNVVIALVVG